MIDQPIILETAAISVVLAVGIVVVVVVVIRKRRHLPSIARSPTSLFSHQTFLLDGSNGPIRLHHSNLHVEDAVSLLHLTSRQRLNVIPLLTQRQTDTTIYFDGRGKPAEQHGTVCPINEYVTVKFTQPNQEADTVMVHAVEAAQCTLHWQAIGDEDWGSQLPRSRSEVWRIRRTDRGPGKFRVILQRYCLLRPHAVAMVLFSGGGNSDALDVDAHETLRALWKARSVLQVERLDVAMMPPETMVVVSDDVLLRQRVNDAHGLVLSFDQLWCLLEREAKLKTH